MFRKYSFIFLSLRVSTLDLISCQFLIKIKIVTINKKRKAVIDCTCRFQHLFLQPLSPPSGSDSFLCPLLPLSPPLGQIFPPVLRFDSCCAREISSKTAQFSSQGRLLPNSSVLPGCIPCIQHAEVAPRRNLSTQHFTY